MNASTEWNLSALCNTPILAPLHPVIAHLQSRQFPTLPQLNGLLRRIQPPIQVQTGHPLRFIPQAPGRMGFESQYEPRCYLTGEVQTRPDNWHDLFNAMVWLTFPKAKAAINSRHFQALSAKAEPGNSQRGRVRDMATLLDESGVVVVSASHELSKLLQTFQWKELFWHRREQVQNEMGFYVLGHGLYEKALHPYIGMTGQGLVLHVSTEFFRCPLQAQISYLDDRVAAYLNNPAHCASTQELHPVPLLGVPGWATENNSEDYYSNTSYFRPGRQYLK